jgi:hypothetical protein
MKVFRWVLTVFLYVVSATCFRADSLAKEIEMLHRMFVYSDGILRPYMLKTGIPAILILYVSQWVGYFIYEKGKEWKISARMEFALYPFAILLLSLFTPDHEIPFIYFQF